MIKMLRRIAQPRRSAESQPQGAPRQGEGVPQADPGARPAAQQVEAPKRDRSWGQWAAGKLRRGPVTTEHMLGSHTELRPTPPRPHVAVSNEEAAKVSLNVRRPPASVRSQVAVVAGKVAAPATRLGVVRDKEAAAAGRPQPTNLADLGEWTQQDLTTWADQLFLTADDDALDGIVQKTNGLLVQVGGQAERLEAQMLLVHALAEATAGHAPAANEAAAALGRALVDAEPADGAHEERAVRGDALTAACLMCGTGPGMDALYPALGVARPEDLPYQALMRKEATRQALHAAGVLRARLGALPGAPVSMDGLAELCRDLLPRAQGGREGGPVANELTRALADDTLSAKAFLAAHALMQEPEVTPVAPLAGAYLAFRNGYRREGPGTELDEVKRRLLKLGVYAKRAAGNRSGLQAMPLRIAEGVLGIRKNPLGAMTKGSGGARLRRVEVDFAKVTTAVNSLLSGMHERLQAEDLTDHEAIGYSIRMAVVLQYHALQAATGWKDVVKIDSATMDRVAADVAQACEKPVDEVRAHPVFESMSNPLIGTRRLEDWAQGLGEEQRETVAALKTLNNAGDPKLPPLRTADEVYDAFRALAHDVTPTFDVKHAAGSRVGINLRTSVLSQLASALTAVGLPVPGGGVGVKASYARIAQVDVGDSSHGGILFVGSDRRRSAGGSAEVGGYSNPGVIWGRASAVLGAGYSYEAGRAKGVMLRTQLISRTAGLTELDGAPPEAPRPPGDEGVEPWRAKLLRAMDLIARAGPAGSFHTDPEAMWDDLAAAFATDLDLSINFARVASSSHDVTAGVSVSASTLAKPKVPRPGAGLAFGGVAQWLGSRRTEIGHFQVDTIMSRRSFAWQVGYFGTLKTPPEVGAQLPGTGQVLSAVTPGALGLAGQSAQLAEDAVQVRLRMAQQDGVINPKLTFMDTEFTSVEQYRRYLASREAGGEGTAWSHSMAESQEEGELALRKYIAEQGGESDRGAKFFCERRQLKEEAARAINNLLARRATVDTSTLLPDRKKRQELDAIDRRVATLLESDGSWSNRFLFTMENNTVQDVSGINYMARAEASDSVSHLHLTDAVKDRLIDAPLPQP